MKKLFLTLAIFSIFCSKSYAQSENLALLAENGFFNHPKASYLSPCEEVKKLLSYHLKYANSYDVKGLETLYADNYVNTDGLDRKIYFDLIQKTWESYPDIVYKMTIKDIEINGNIAVAQVEESATATTNSKSGLVNEKGLLESASSSVYYLEKINDAWKITSDRILFEKTFLRYGCAKDINITLVAPPQILADRQYTTSLKIDSPKDSFVIASIGQEKITYPQSVSEEVFRKLPEDGVLERIFESNKDNLNEYAVASFGITQAKIDNGKDVRISITGLGFVMSRINVIPRNDFVKVAENEKTN